MSTFMTYNTSRQIATIETSVMFFDSLITSGTANFYTSLQLRYSSRVVILWLAPLLIKVCIVSCHEDIGKFSIE